MKPWEKAEDGISSVPPGPSCLCSRGLQVHLSPFVSHGAVGTTLPRKHGREQRRLANEHSGRYLFRVCSFVWGGTSGLLWRHCVQYGLCASFLTGGKWSQDQDYASGKARTWRDGLFLVHRGFSEGRLWWRPFPVTPVASEQHGGLCREERESGKYRVFPPNCPQTTRVIGHGFGLLIEPLHSSFCVHVTWWFGASVSAFKWSTT
jgi:hypothetical protein